MSDARRDRTQDAASRAETLRLTAASLLESVQYNGERASVLTYMINKHVAFWDTPLETARWEALRDSFVRSSDDARLIDEVALFFSDVKLNADRVDRLFTFAFGQWSKHPHAKAVADGIGGHLLQSLPELEQAATALSARLTPLTQ